MSSFLQDKIKGRGAGANPSGRFEKLALTELEPDDPARYDQHPEDDDVWDTGILKTQFLSETPRTILTRNDSPDIGMEATLNPYRGCEHGCIYCYARPYHEYGGLSAGLDFESKIFVKHNAPELLRQELNKKSYEPAQITMSGVTDCYQPVERRVELTRRCLQVMAEFRNPVGIITKNHLVTRDIDVLTELASFNGVRVMISLTTLDADLAKKMEPRTSRPAARLKAIETLAKAGVPVGVMTAPIIPGLTEHELPDLLKAAADAGAKTAGYTIVRLSHGLKDLFQGWLDEHYPLKKSRVLGRIRDVRGGELNDTRFGIRMRGEGPYAEHIKALYTLHKKKNGLDKGLPPLTTEHFRRRPADGQMSLF